MSEELNGLWGPGPNRPVGEASLERSGSEASPTGAVGGGGPGGGPQGPSWEDPEPHHPQQPELDSGVEAEAVPDGDPRDWEPDPMPPNLVARARGALAKKPEGPKMPLSPQQKLLLLDTWQRSGLPARDFGALVNISRHPALCRDRLAARLPKLASAEIPHGPATTHLAATW